jgi:hypothetical protein
MRGLSPCCSEGRKRKVKVKMKRRRGEVEWRISK